MYTYMYVALLCNDCMPSTVDSLSRIPRDSLKYFEISVPRHVRFAEFRKKMNRTATFNKCICNLTPEITDILKILWKRGEIVTCS